jgi:hypothetical protein
MAIFVRGNFVARAKLGSFIRRSGDIRRHILPRQGRLSL